MRCEEVREMLPACGRGSPVALEVRRHLAACQGCSAELERYRALLEALDRLEARPVQPPAGLAAALADIPRRAGTVDWVRAHVSRNRRGYASGAAALALATAAGALLWRSRRAGPATA